MGNTTGSELKYGEKLSNDLKLTWKKSANALVGREGHCSACCDGTLFVFGGVVLLEEDGMESNELLTFDNGMSFHSCRCGKL